MICAIKHGLLARPVSEVVLQTQVEFRELKTITIAIGCLLFPMPTLSWPLESSRDQSPLPSSNSFNISLTISNNSSGLRLLKYDAMWVSSCKPHEHQSNDSEVWKCQSTSIIYRYRPSGVPSFFLYNTYKQQGFSNVTRNPSVYLTFSLAAVKSAFVTRIRRSRKANIPDSVQTALISAPERSSLAMMNSSRSTSSLRLMREVCNLR